MCDYLSALSDHPQSEEAGGSPFGPMLVLIIVIIIGFHGCDVVQEGREKYVFPIATSAPRLIVKKGRWRVFYNLFFFT